VDRCAGCDDDIDDDGHGGCHDGGNTDHEAGAKPMHVVRVLCSGGGADVTFGSLTGGI
jgi:hypothetical protein